MEVFTQEFRFSSNSDGPLQWVGGLYLMDFEETMNSYLDFGWIILEADDPSIHVQCPSKQDAKRKATWRPLVTSLMKSVPGSGAGLRIDRWESDEEAVDIGHSASKDDVEVLPKISLTRHFNNDSMAYLTVSKGFEPGGWVGLLVARPPSMDRMVKKRWQALSPRKDLNTIRLERVTRRRTSSGNRGPVFH